MLLFKKTAACYICGRLLLEGVKSTAVGYTGGWFKNPTYRDVCTGKGGTAIKR